MNYLSWQRETAVSLLIFSALTLLLAPRQMPPSYDWLQHTTSESAAQGVEGAWLARLGFMILGLTVIWLSVLLREQWSQPVRLPHLAFGVLIVGAAVFSSKPWLPELPFDPVEDWLHSFAASAMGFAFALGITLRWWKRPWQSKMRLLDMVAVAASVVIPLSMSLLPDWDGLLQRIMFAIAYLWYGLELCHNEPGNQTAVNPETTTSSTP
ncbi:DUF998 domain-containing protein [Candidatus Leptofilum sp.]|uniref:DUF998 domain-containing protein n=1 Tax=Candidatus Leptofilum sp. TaxID=3241576 RepID=UPI003B58F4B4